jgi:hypothetical protein
MTLGRLSRRSLPSLMLSPTVPRPRERITVHSFVAYLASSPASSFRFDDPPFQWRSIPIIDRDRLVGLLPQPVKASPLGAKRCWPLLPCRGHDLSVPRSLKPTSTCTNVWTMNAAATANAVGPAAGFFDH